jgi:hypothetical protein
LLASVPSVARIDPATPDDEHWRFSKQGLEQLLNAAFGSARIEVRAEGNPSAVVAFLTGLAAEEVGYATLDRSDPSTSVVVTARVVKAPGDAGE